MKDIRASDRLIFALDVPTSDEAMALVNKTRAHVGVFKVGLELFCAEGMPFLMKLSEQGLGLFLDLKFHDIPNTVGRALETVLVSEPRFCTVHASGGPSMLQEAQRVVERLGVQTQILAVSVLTHLSAEDLVAVGQGEGVDAQVENLTRLAAETGVGGCVCSPLEAALVRRACGPDFTIVCPGVRPADAAHHDQTRVMTPAQALAAGADYLVVGRPIRQAKEPSEAARRVAEEIAGALALGAR